MIFRRITRVTARSVALIFTAWWLVATSKPGPPRDCFSGIGDMATLEVHVKSGMPYEPPGCLGADGIAPGSTLVFDVTRSEPTNECTGYVTSAIRGLAGVTLASPPSAVGGWDFTRVPGTFVLPQDPTCKADYFIDLKPWALPPIGQTVSPLDASPGAPWLVDRSIEFPKSQACQATFGPTTYCRDLFNVESITQPPGP
jgi:hypothetical protein